MKNWKTWLRAAGVRAVKTVAQTAVATIGTAAVMGEVNWVMVGSAAALAGVLQLRQQPIAPERDYTMMKPVLRTTSQRKAES